MWPFKRKEKKFAQKYEKKPEAKRASESGYAGDYPSCADHNSLLNPLNPLSPFSPIHQQHDEPAKPAPIETIHRVDMTPQHVIEPLPSHDHSTNHIDHSSSHDCSSSFDAGSSSDCGSSCDGGSSGGCD